MFTRRGATRCVNVHKTWGHTQCQCSQDVGPHTQCQCSQDVGPHTQCQCSQDVGPHAVSMFTRRGATHSVNVHKTWGHTHSVSVHKTWGHTRSQFGRCLTSWWRLCSHPNYILNNPQDPVKTPYSNVLNHSYHFVILVHSSMHKCINTFLSKHC